ncbi:hypothetical protein ACFYXH_01755 [Streptomyces sp. NPDC002730]|uniref:hypothetical protein n=1 Tax=Streptomyces sp. NPDC002730 TaxID=3364662 RepID=UPI0036990763
MRLISEAPETVQLAADTGQNGVAALGMIVLGLLVLIMLCAYLFPTFIARRGFAAPTLAGTLRDIAVVCVTVALALYVYGLMCYIRLENESYTCATERYGYSSGNAGARLERMQDSLFPVGSTCRWSDGYTHDFVPAFVDPAITVLLSLAVIAAGVALGHAGAARDAARRS